MRKIDFDWKDISMEIFREYDFPSPHGIVKVHIAAPMVVAISKSERGDSHRVIDTLGGSHYIPAGWIALHWQVREGAEKFTF
jgi:hypothetical protein